MGKKRRLLDEYQFPGFGPKAEIKGIFGDSKARVIQLKRTQKTVCGCCGKIHWSHYDKKVRRGTGFILWGCTDLPGSGGVANILSAVWEREAGKTGMAREQSLLHETICLFCETEVSNYDGQ